MYIPICRYTRLDEFLRAFETKYIIYFSSLIHIYLIPTYTTITYIVKSYHTIRMDSLFSRKVWSKQ